tara:strand:- start:19 stop:681 length:663 start_codon:yes stop_codon:yes gene_type:complete
MSINFLSNLPNEVFWLWLSGLIFLVMTLIFRLGFYYREKSELMTAFLGFLGGMSIFHIFGGASMLWDNPFLMYVAVFVAVSGSALVVKFPLLSIPNVKLRKTLFYAALMIAWGLVLWLLVYGANPMLSMKVASIYMIFFSGISGIYMIWKGFFIKEPANKIKCLGGGCSIWFCCFLTHILVLAVGMIVLAKLFMVLTPVVLVLTVYIARKVANQMKRSSV